MNWLDALPRAQFSLLIVFIVTIFRLFFWTEPYGVSVDESSYMAISEVMQSGGTLYLDAVDRKPPGLFWIYALHGFIFGSWNIFSLHLFSLFAILLLCFAIGQLTQSLFESGFRGAAFLFAIASSCFPREITSLNAEVFMLLFLWPSIWLLLRFIKSSYRIDYFLVVSGVLAAISTLMKQYSAIVYALGVTLMSLHYLWVDYKFSFYKLSHLLKSISLMLLGVLITYLVTTLYFWSQGATFAFLNYFLLDGLKYVATSREQVNHQTSGLVATLGMVAAWLPLWWLSIKLLKQFKKVEVWLLTGVTIGSIFTIYLSGRYYTHYFLPAIFFICIAAGALIKNEARFSQKIILSYMFISALAFGILNFWRDDFMSSSFSKPNQRLLVEAGEHLRSISYPEDKLVVWGMASQLYLTSQRGSGTRFVFADFVAGRQPGLKSSVSVPTPGAQEEFLNDLENKKPRWILDTSSAELNDYGHFPLERFPNIYQFIEQQYEFVGEHSKIKFWKLKEVL